MIKFFSYLSPKELIQLSCKEKKKVFGSIINNEVSCPCRCPHCGSYLVISEDFLQCSNCNKIYSLYFYKTLRGESNE